MKKAEFLAAARQAALAASRASGFLPGVTVAQAALESAWGRSRLAQDAHNYFGIKAHGAHPWIEFPTAEFEDGVRVCRRARFALYRSMEECFRDRDLLIQRSPRYHDVREHATHAEEFIRALAMNWATDPEYAEKVLRVYRASELPMLDRDFLAKERTATIEQL